MPQTISDKKVILTEILEILTIIGLHWLYFNNCTMEKVYFQYIFTFCNTLIINNFLRNFYSAKHFTCTKNYIL